MVIAKAREVYRPIAERGSLMYFLIDQLHVISHMYQFSLDTFNYMFVKALLKATPVEGEAARCEKLMSSVTFVIFSYVTRGLFEADRLIFSSQLGFRIKARLGELPPEELDFMIKAPRNVDSGERSEAMEWLPEACWQCVEALADR